MRQLSFGSQDAFYRLLVIVRDRNLNDVYYRENSTAYRSRAVCELIVYEQSFTTLYEMDYFPFS
jgi:hypothetical protein